MKPSSGRLFHRETDNKKVSGRSSPLLSAQQLTFFVDEAD
jgi:hypothetical protein